MEQRNQSQHAANAVQDGRGWHAEHAQPDLVRRTADDEEGRDGRDGDDRRPVYNVEAPAAVRAQRAVEPLLLHQAQRSDGKLDVCRPAPDGRDDGKDDPARDMARVSHRVVEQDRHYRAVDEDHDGEEDQPPALPAVMPRKRQLGQQLGVVAVVVHQRAVSSLPLPARSGPRVVVNLCMWAQGI